MTWRPRVIQGGSSPLPAPPLSWERAGELVHATWPAAWTTFRIVEGELVLEDGARPDARTLAELEADVTRSLAGERTRYQR